MASLAVNPNDPSTLGTVASFEMPGNFMFGPPVQLPMEVGSPDGVPQADSIVGETPATGANAHDKYGAIATSKAAHQQPIFWLFVLMALGVVILAGHAHQAVKGL